MGYKIKSNKTTFYVHDPAGPGSQKRKTEEIEVIEHSNVTFLESGNFPHRVEKIAYEIPHRSIMKEADIAFLDGVISYTPFAAKRIALQENLLQKQSSTISNKKIRIRPPPHPHPYSQKKLTLIPLLNLSPHRPSPFPIVVLRQSIALQLLAKRLSIDPHLSQYPEILIPLRILQLNRFSV